MLIKLIGLILTTFVAASALADDPFINLFVGQGYHQQESMMDSKTQPVGVLYGIGMGRRFNFYEFELSVSSGAFTADVEHDGEANTVTHDQLQVNLAFNFYIVKHFYLRLGYGLTDVDQSTEVKLTGDAAAGFQSEYDLKSQKVTAPLIGAGVSFVQTSKLQLFVQFEHHIITEIKAIQNQFTAGLRYYFN